VAHHDQVAALLEARDLDLAAALSTTVAASAAAAAAISTITSKALMSRYLRQFRLS